MKIYKELYKELVGIVNSNIPEIKWVDMWRNQVGMFSDDQEESIDRIPSPAIFFKFRLPQADSKGNQAQDGELIVDVYFWHNTLSKTHAGSKNQENALGFLEVMDKIHHTFHNVSGVHFSTMDFIGPDPIETGGPDVLNRLMFRTLLSWYKNEELTDVTNPALDVVEGDITVEIDIDPLFDIINPMAEGSEQLELDTQDNRVTHVDSTGEEVKLPPGEPMVCTVPDTESVLSTADLDFAENSDALLSNPDTLAFIDAHKTCPNKVSEMLAAAELYFTRIGSSNSVIENYINDWARGVGQDLVMYSMVKSGIVYLGYPGSEEQGVVPFFDLRGTNVVEDRIQKLNSPLWSEARGFEGDGISGSYYIPILPNDFPFIKHATQYMRLTKASTNGMRFGCRVNSSKGWYMNTGDESNAGIVWQNVSLTGMDFTELGGFLMSVYGGTYDFPEATFESFAFTGSNYNTPAATAIDTTPNFKAQISNRYIHLNAYHANAIPALPTSFSNHALGSIIICEHMEVSVAKAFAQLNDTLQVNLGR